MIRNIRVKPNMNIRLFNNIKRHGGPFANIAHGCNSIIATNLALHLSDYTLTEAGFGADLGAEKFLDIVTPHLEQTPEAVVVVATVRALKYHGGQPLDQISQPNTSAIQSGFRNLQRHLINLQKYQVPVIVAINQFTSDTPAEIQLVQQLCQEMGIHAYPVTVHDDGGVGALNLAQALIDLPNKADWQPLYAPKRPLKTKLIVLPQKFTVPDELFIVIQPASNYKIYKNVIGINCQSVLPKHNILLAMILICWEPQIILICMWKISVLI